MAATDPAAAGGRAADRAYAALRDRIIGLAIPPGSAIVEDELIRALGVGRTPLREAIGRLAHEGLVDVRPRRGTVASPVDVSHLAAIAELRAELEGHAAFRAAGRASIGDRRELERLAGGLSTRTRDPRAVMEVDARIHVAVHRAARNPFLARSLGVHYDLSRRIWNLAAEALPRMRDVVAEHAALLEAILAGDGARARTIAEAHVRAFEAEVQPVLAARPAPAAGARRDDRPSPMARRAYAELRRRIVDLRLPPGSPISERTLMTELGTGRTPLREAVLQLSREFLVEVYPSRGTFVTEVNLGDLAAICDVRARTDGLAAALAARGGGRDRLAAGGYRETFEAIYRRAGNPYLEATAGRFLALSERLWALAREAGAGDLDSAGVAGLTVAIDAGDGPAARRLAQRHVRALETAIRTALVG